MARSAKTSAETKPSNALIPWEDQMAKDAEVAAGMEANTGGSQFFSIRGGILSFNDMPLPGNQMAAVVLDSIFENVYYSGDFDPGNPSPPDCFAFGRVEEELRPHDVVFDHDQAENEVCKGCEMNAWGSADKGRGKACRNTRRLGIIPGGTLTEQGVFKAFTTEDEYAKSTMGLLKLPVTSVKGWANFVKQIAGTLHMPPHGIFTKIRVVPDPKTQFKVVFEPIAKIPAAFGQIILQRRQEVMTIIDFPYNLDVDEAPPPAPPPPARGKAAPAKRGR
jgi:hypothetical protein